MHEVRKAPDHRTRAVETTFGGRSSYSHRVRLDKECLWRITRTLQACERTGRTGTLEEHCGSRRFSSRCGE